MRVESNPHVGILNWLLFVVCGFTEKIEDPVVFYGSTFFTSWPTGWPTGALASAATVATASGAAVFVCVFVSDIKSPKEN